ncbi:glucoamylase family protein [Anaerocolumna xylanovorans]|uniref:Putative glucoamylase n=1 Tax=Anaerocolumna xylanovorans DSM 12503 TaxID=1121345 RepID=A0A1M7XZR9_9FIRM|nr:glucoamylase family protein [Anaerocolumna xylanovorans]SHO44674.1 Putative glucoamylase [Anaerocolumna xylanovorans DSM 12503]
MLLDIQDIFINYLTNMSVGFRVSLIIAALSCMLAFIYYRFIHFRKRVNLPVNLISINDILGQKEQEQQMVDMAKNHKQIKLMRYNFVLGDYNKIAYKKLNRIRNSVSEIPADIITLIPAARWLFDNFQMMYREIKKVKISGTSYEMLPILRKKEYRGYPRIYMVTKKMVALSGGHLDEKNISIMINAYQKEIPLTDKELWVLPEMIGFCLLESIIEVAEDIVRIIKIKSKADKFVKEKLAAQQGILDITALLSEIDSECKYNYSFHAHVIYLLKSMSFEDESIQRYLTYHYKLKGKHIIPSKVFLEEGKLESYLESNIHALIVSLREINEADEEKSFEEFSAIERILSKDPDGVYTKMDSESRGIYRGEIVKLSLKYKINESKIAEDCLELAMEGREDFNCSHHVGAYLLEKGHNRLKAKILNKPISKKVGKKQNIRGLLYFLCIFLMLFSICFFVIHMMRGAGGIDNLFTYIIILMVALPLLFAIALEITNHIFTRRLPVKKIPSLDYLKEIPDCARTFVVMPVLVNSEEQCIQYLARLEKHYLANRQSNLYFAILADFEDSTDLCMPKDEVLKNVLINRIHELNKLYPFSHQRFSLFIRSRKWNESEECYMGWERKRGKLEEFNNLLHGTRKEDTGFSTLLYDEQLLGSFKYVITLDADSNLIRDNAAKFVGLIDHPLNQPVIDPVSKKVVEGYGIIQPTIRNHIVDKKSSRFPGIFGGESGLTHYSAVISDIYQDIFKEGVYTGKGIYHIEAFYLILNNTIHENSVLSHDLLESCYVRTAFSSSVKIMDTFPSSVLSFVNREHRWIRGDWQLLPWLFKKKALNAISKWKIFDNLRRSLVPISKTLLIVLNLAIMPNIYYLWLPLVFFSDILNLVILLIGTFTQKIKRPMLTIVYKGLFRESGVMVERAFMELVLTPYRAYTAIDAIIRTLFRVLVSEKKLLRWNASETVDASIINSKKGYFLNMWSSLIPAAAILALLIGKEIPLLGIVLYGAVMFIWSISCFIAYYISQPRIQKLQRTQTEDKELLLETARRTWRFFKDHSTKENNWLCPDNYQIAYIEKISDKTSPTNIGLQLLAILSARDFGYETLGATIGLAENLLGTVVELPKWKGHLYNWYNINTLTVLNPEYISTVDSGNFLGHLIVFKNGLLEQIETPIFPESLIAEIRYSIKLCDSGMALKDDYTTIGEFAEDLANIREHLINRELLPSENSAGVRELLRNMELMINEAESLELKEIRFSANPSLKLLALNGNNGAKAMIERIERISSTANNILENVDFRFLYNEKRMLFHIGYHVSTGTIDKGCYDLMASESSLTSFVAIARGDVPLKHWYKLGRPLTMVKGIPCFVSWSGTMFEYLMPNLVMKEYEGSAFAETSKAAVLQQIKYAKHMGIPWGISESQYYRFDLDSNYQYRAFGVPKLRLQPARKNSLVVAPYATILALEYAAKDCFSNLKKMTLQGAFGNYGYYEAIDFNGPDSLTMEPYCIVKSYMAHHQGMNLVAINNFLNDGIMRRRFHAEAIIKATEVLLEEKRESHFISIARKGYTIKMGNIHFKEEVLSNRYVNSVAPVIPVAGYLSNNKYALMITSDGDGFSNYNDMMLYRWRADLYANTGNYIYIKDINEGKFWSATYNPTKTEPEEYQAVFFPHQAEFRRTDGDISSHTVVSLSPNHNIEIRKLTLTNNGNAVKQIEITSYMEVVGDSYRAELSHPAFNKLFIESEFLEEQSVFLSKRRGNKDGGNPYIMHMVKPGVKLTKSVEYGNDRLKFIGRNNTLQNPNAVVNSISLSNNTGFCNDPIMSLRVNISLGINETASISFITGVCNSKEEAVKISEELSVAYRIDDIFEKFRLQSEIELKYLDISRPLLNAFQDLISPIFYPSSYYRGPAENIRRNWKNQSFLWKFGVSGDNPVMLLRVKSIEDAGIIKNVLKAYEYLRINRVKVDLIILSEAKQGYLQELTDLLDDMTSSLRIYDASRERPSLFILHSYQMIPAELDLLFTVARVVFSEKTGVFFGNIKENLKEIKAESY